MDLRGHSESNQENVIIPCGVCIIGNNFTYATIHNGSRSHENLGNFKNLITFHYTTNATNFFHNSFAAPAT